MKMERGDKARSLPDRILIYLYDRPQGATTPELAIELSQLKKAILVGCKRLEVEGWISGEIHREPRAYGHGKPSKLWKVIA